MSKTKVLIAGIVLFALTLVAIFFVPNPIGSFMISEAKANGYLEYSPEEAVTLARKICTQCHSDERIKLYCPRCGPPFVAVVPHMQVFIKNFKASKPNIHFENITEHQAVAIVQVWNALVGNWEKDFREKDVLKLIGHFDKLAALLKTPVEDRRIEYALSQRDDLKIGHMSGLADSQKDLGKPENNPQPGDKPSDNLKGQEDAPHDHTGHDMGDMKHDMH